MTFGRALERYEYATEAQSRTKHQNINQETWFNCFTYRWTAFFSSIISLLAAFLLLTAQDETRDLHKFGMTAVSMVSSFKWSRIPVLQIWRGFFFKFGARRGTACSLGANNFFPHVLSLKRFCTKHTFKKRQLEEVQAPSPRLFKRPLKTEP